MTVPAPQEDAVVNVAAPGRLFRIPATGPIVPDPIHAESDDSQMLVAELFSGLTRFEEVGGRWVVANELADHLTLSDDGKHLRFTLRIDLRYSDGSPLLASHFKWSWERALRESTATSRAIIPSYRLADALFVIEGAESVAKGSSHDHAGVSAIDSRVLEVRLKAPTSNFLMRLAEPYAVVLNPENVED